MKTPLLITAALAAFIATAQARIGETEAQLAQRYGKPIKTLKDETMFVRCYRFNGFDIDVTIVNGRSAIETYKKQDGSFVSTEEGLAIMRANVGENIYPPACETHKMENGTEVITFCGDKTVAFNSARRDLTIGLRSALEGVAGKVDAANKKKLSGF